MRAMSLFVVLVAFSASLFGEDLTGEAGGRKVILHDNHTWEFLKDPSGAPTEALILSKLPSQTETVKGRAGKYSLSYDPTAWRKVEITNKSAEFQFQNNTSL